MGVDHFRVWKEHGDEAKEPHIHQVFIDKHSTIEKAMIDEVSFVRFSKSLPVFDRHALRAGWPSGP